MKKFTQSTWAIFAIATLTMLSFTQCSDDDKEDEETPAAPTLSAIDPTMGGVGETITLTGANFSTSASTVTFTSDAAETEATVSSATATTIECVVPDLENGEYDVSVTANEQTTAAKTFSVVATPVVSSFTDGLAYGDEVTITGENFGTEPTVTINGVEQTPVSATDTEIKITLVAKTFSGDLVVTNADGLSSEAEAYTYVETYTYEDFMTGVDFQHISFDNEGNMYLIDAQYNLHKYDSAGNYIEELINRSSGRYVTHTFIGEDQTMYIADAAGRILTMNLETKDVEVFLDETTSLVPLNAIFQIVGDNNGNLYYSTSNGYQLVRCDIATKGTEVMYTSSVDGNLVTGIDLLGDTIYFSENIGTNLKSISADAQEGDEAKIVYDDQSIYASGVKAFADDRIYVRPYGTSVYLCYKGDDTISVLENVAYSPNTIISVTLEGDIVTNDMKIIIQ